LASRSNILGFGLYACLGSRPTGSLLHSPSQPESDVASHGPRVQLDDQAEHKGRAREAGQREDHDCRVVRA